MQVQLYISCCCPHSLALAPPTHSGCLACRAIAGQEPQSYCICNIPGLQPFSTLWFMEAQWILQGEGELQGRLGAPVDSSCQAAGIGLYSFDLLCSFP